jgi:hypothetical protein
MRDTIRYASLKTTKFIAKDSYSYEKAKTYNGHKLLAKAFGWVFDQMVKRGFLQPYFDEIKMETYDHTPTKSKLVSDRVLEAIHAHERDFGRVSPETHVILMGEDDFFQSVNEKRMDSPFFGKEYVQMQTDLRFNASPYKQSAVGMPIYVVPSIMGLAIVPKATIEKHV